MTWDLLYIELKEALQQAGCPICWHMEQATRKHLWSFLREGKNNGKVYLSLVRSFRLCHRHAWLLAEIESVTLEDGMSTATLYRDLLAELLRRLKWELEEERGKGPAAKQASGDGERGSRLQKQWRLFRRRQRIQPKARGIVMQLISQERCIACGSLEEYERVVAWGLQRFLSSQEGDEAIIQRFRNSSGLCLSHFRMALEEAEDQTAVETLIEVERARMTVLLAELEEYLRKHDYRYAHEPYGAEKDSWLRAIELFVGKGRFHPSGPHPSSSGAGSGVAGCRQSRQRRPTPGRKP